MASPISVLGVAKRLIVGRNTARLEVLLQDNSNNIQRALSLIDEGVEIVGPIDVEMGDPKKKPEDPNQTEIEELAQ